MQQLLEHEKEALTKETADVEDMHCTTRKLAAYRMF